MCTPGCRLRGVAIQKPGNAAPRHASQVPGQGLKHEVHLQCRLYRISRLVTSILPFNLHVVSLVASLARLSSGSSVRGAFHFSATIKMIAQQGNGQISGWLQVPEGLEYLTELSREVLVHECAQKEAAHNALLVSIGHQDDRLSRLQSEIPSLQATVKIEEAKVCGASKLRSKQDTYEQLQKSQTRIWNDSDWIEDYVGAGEALERLK